MSAHAAAVDDGSRGASYCTVDAAESAARRFPELPPVIAHAGGPDFTEYLALLSDAPQVWMDLSGVFPGHPRLGEFAAGLVPALREVADRLVWTRTCPLPPPPSTVRWRGSPRRLHRG